MDEEVEKMNLCDSVTHLEKCVCLHVTEEISVTFGATVRTQIMILGGEPGVEIRAAFHFAMEHNQDSAPTPLDGN